MTYCIQMFGWRARIGLLVPVDNAVIEPELACLPVDGVSVHVVRLTTMERAAMPRNGIELASLFTELGVDAVGYACAETSFPGETDINDLIVREIGRDVGVPVVTAAGAMVTALRALGLESVACASPYPVASGDALAGLLQRAGIDVVNSVHEDLVSASKGVREWALTNEQPPSTAARLARRADHPSADGVLVSATNLRTLPVLASLEGDLGKPVVSSNSAMYWALLHAAGCREIPGQLGGLSAVVPA